MKSYFVGHTRFSLFEPDSASWRLSRSLGKVNRAAYSKALFEEQRLESRARIFFDLSLPILNKAQKDMNFFHVVSYSEELPEKYQKKLENAQRIYSWLYLDRRTPSNRKGLSLKDFIIEMVPPNSIVGLFRLDDDDLLSLDYFEQAERYLAQPFVGMNVSLGLGIQAIYEEGTFKGPRLEHRPKIAIGLLKVCWLKNDQTIEMPFNVAHPRSDRKNPVVVDSRNIAFVHSMHLGQDSGVEKPSNDLSLRYRNYINLPKIDPQYQNYRKIFPGVHFEDESINLASPHNIAKSVGMGRVFGEHLRRLKKQRWRWF